LKFIIADGFKNKEESQKYFFPHGDKSPIFKGIVIYWDKIMLPYGARSKQLDLSDLPLFSYQ
jgi:hypothetical protein